VPRRRRRHPRLKRENLQTVKLTIQNRIDAVRRGEVDI
jgi:hypothetical protein